MADAPIRSVTILDVRGRVAATLRGNGRTRLALGLNGLATGIYTLRIKTVDNEIAALNWTYVH
jgi:hypothetical protein